MPQYYQKYYAQLSDTTSRTFEKAADAKATLADSSGIVEPKIAYDLADRVAKMHDIDIAKPLRDLLNNNGKELSALKMAREIAQGRYLPPDSTLEERLDLSIRVGLAIVTEGVTIAPLQGINEVVIKKNKNGTQYLSVSIAGPMRSAGGTESAVTILIADHVRKIAGLDRYQANCFDDETGRFVEELRIYERDAGNFQFHVLDEDIIYVISHLPVEIDGVDTDPLEVVNHRTMYRIKTNRVRGGALRVLNDGIIGRAKKLLKRIDLYKLDGWEWLNDLKGAVQTGNEEDAASKRMREVITGRSVLSTPGRLGGFRLRYGRACNTGFTAIGFHPVIAEILDHTIAVGTQVKIDMPGKGATVAFVDSIETPTVMLRGGDVVRIRDVAHGVSLKPQIERILHLGDVLVSFGDFLESNAQLVPSGYVEEYWLQDLALAAGQSKAAQHRLQPPTLEQALHLCDKYDVPLYPRYLHYWDMISIDDLKPLLKGRTTGDKTMYPPEVKNTLETLAVPHRVIDGQIVLQGAESQIFQRLLLSGPFEINAQISVIDNIAKNSGVILRPKFSTSIGVRVGRPEKAAPRKLKPPIHTLFPVGDKGGIMRNILDASHAASFYTNILNRACQKCQAPSIAIRCLRCNQKTHVTRTCPSCRQQTQESKCGRCNRNTSAHSYHTIPLKEMLFEAQRRTGYRAQDPFKGVRELISQDRVPEPLEKGLLRQSYGLTAFKDGTTRYDATNSPLTHFKPAWISTTPDDLRKLGYTHDADDRPLTDPQQTVELMMQDVIIPFDCGRYMVNVCRYIDAELNKLYGKPAFYNVKSTNDLLGHLIVGLAPHTSVGVVGRIIGYTKTHVCFGTPNWHSAKRRDADGDADSVMLLMDALLNFSRHFLSDKIGGLMDAPLLVQPLVVPHESQPQAHNIEVVKHLPLDFFRDTLQSKKAASVESVETVKNRLDSASQFSGYHYTHPTSSLVTSKSRSSYPTSNSILDKLDIQIHNANLIDAVDTVEIVSNVLSTHLVPDIMGNLGAYAKQSFRCTACMRRYRRPPLTKKCMCGNKLTQTISRSSVEKYLQMAKRMTRKYDVGKYQKDRIAALAGEVDMVFGKSAGDQQLLTDYT